MSTYLSGRNSWSYERLCWLVCFKYTYIVSCSQIWILDHGGNAVQIITYVTFDEVVSKYPFLSLQHLILQTESSSWISLFQWILVILIFHNNHRNHLVYFGVFAMWPLVFQWKDYSSMFLILHSQVTQVNKTLTRLNHKTSNQSFLAFTTTKSSNL